MRTLGVVIIMVCWLLLAGCQPAEAVKGTVTYPGQITLPAGAVLTVELLDFSRMDEPRVIKTVGKQAIKDPGLAPVPFEIHYKLSDINTRHAYFIQASIAADGKLLFTTATPIRVITHANPNEVEIILQEAG